MHTLECTHLFEGCPGVVEAETPDQVVALAAEHAAQTHGVTSLDDDTMTALRAAITTT